MRRLRFLLLLLMTLLITACYNQPTGKSVVRPRKYTTQQQDSINFSVNHHYTNKYNFVVKADSIVLYIQQPEEIVNKLPVDSFGVKKHKLLVVSDVMMVPQDSVDSVWIQLGTEDAQIGWIHESKLLPNVVPDDPISQFISTFSDTHILVTMVVVVIIFFLYFIRKIFHEKGPIVFFNDIDSFYPTLLCLTVAASASLYASIQMFSPDSWQEFYFHPTLNPFSVRGILRVFLLSVWAMLIIAIAVLDDIYHALSFADAILYLCGLVGVCAVSYILFSISTLYYIGYPLLALYIFWSVRLYYRRHRFVYYCGNCGAKLHRKGRCPHCGAFND
ncbi:MAG: zinc ribbon domain-containing protein [Prevotellaceae bacterium]|nr:zinc ribbon domain-containing protein [Prevotellaceae bacterium]